MYLRSPPQLAKLCKKSAIQTSLLAFSAALHNISHPGVRGSQRLVLASLVCPGLAREVRAWARACLQCK